MPPAAGEIAADLDRPRRPDADDGPPRGDAGDSSTPPPTLHSIRERSTARRAGSMRTERRRGDCTGHGAHLTAAGEIAADLDRPRRPDGDGPPGGEHTARPTEGGDPYHTARPT